MYGGLSPLLVGNNFAGVTRATREQVIPAIIRGTRCRQSRVLILWPNGLRRLPQQGFAPLAAGNRGQDGSDPGGCSSSRPG